MDDISPTAGTAAAPYRVLARKYRPQRFEDLVGQEPMVRTLTNAFATGRIAQAFLLTGVRGVGKTTTARILARALNYTRPGHDRPSVDFSEPGEHDTAIMEGRHIDVIEMDAASHTGIGDVREIIEAVRYKPALARYKVYIIDEVHMLSNQAFNGLLKTLEEPPEHVKFVFATTEIRKVPVTVLSRCQRFDLRRIEADRLVQLLSDITAKENVAIDRDALAVVARAAEGSARDALSLLDQAIAHRGADETITSGAMRALLGLADRTRTIDLFAEVMRGDASTALATLRDLYDAGADPQLVLQDLANFTHLVTRLKTVPDAATDPALTEEERIRGAELAEKLSIRVLSRCWQMLLKGIEEASTAPRPLAAADMVLVRIAHVADLPTPDEALKMLAERGPEALGGAAGSVAAAGSAATPRAGASAAGDPGPAMRMVESAAPRMRAAASPMRASSAAVAAAPTPASPPMGRATPAAQPAPVERPKTLGDIVALATKHRDLPMKHGIERYVRVIRFEPPNIELALTPDAPSGFLTDLGKRLADWTGERWMIAVGNGEPEATLHEQATEAKARVESDARNDPTVLAVMRHFPGAEIVDIRVKPREPAIEPMEEPPAPVEADEDDED
ncbi:MAG: DNA polymerase III subunit gamma/tau [Bauldia sp.]|nr:DNA polymerase III subunit gamma/tau [Bauldia sp.]